MMRRVTALLGAMLLVVAACGDSAPQARQAPTAIPQPVPTATVMPAPPSVSQVPDPTTRPTVPTPGASHSAAVVVGASLPIRTDGASTTVDLVPGPEGHLFVKIPTKKGTVLASIDGKGRVREGWPLLLRRASRCEVDADLDDGSLRAVCVVGSKLRAFALNADGQLIAGWPVDLPGGSLPGWMSDPTGLVDGVLYAITAGSDPVSASLVRVSRSGSVQAGARVVGDDSSAFMRAVVGPDGTGYVIDLGDDSTIWAFDLDGIRPGFPVDLEGWASTPSFGPEGRIYVTVDDPDDEGSASSRVTVLTASGRVVRGWPVTIPVDTWTGYGDPPAPPFPPVVASDGSVYVTGWIAARDGMTAYALRPSADRRTGWPYRSREPIRTGRPTGFVCMCEPCAFPELVIYTPPIAGPDDSLLLAQIRDPSVAGGNRLVAVRPDGAMKPGWPVTLAEKDSWIARVASGAGGVVYAFAVEPAGSRRNECGERYPVYSGTIVALDRHGDAVYTTTLVVP